MALLLRGEGCSAASAALTVSVLMPCSGRLTIMSGYAGNTMSKRITNINYRRFLEEGIIDMVEEKHVRMAMKNIVHFPFKKEAKALLIMLYYTGARTNEVLRIRAVDVSKEKSYVKVKIAGSKKGLPRTFYLPYRLEMVKELYKYTSRLYPEMPLFFHFKYHYKRRYKRKDGSIKEYVQTSDKVHYYVKKWFTGVLPGSIPPYFFRHSRFSQLTEAGLSSEEIMMLKGGRSLSSVRPYQHMSKKTGVLAAKRIV